MPPLTAELAGLIAVAVALIIIALVVDPTLRARRAANRAARSVQARSTRPAGGKGARR